MSIEQLAGAHAPKSIQGPEMPRGEGCAYLPLRCQGEANFTTALAADVARLLDVDPAVSHWRCQVPVAWCDTHADFATYGDRGLEYLFVGGCRAAVGAATAFPPAARFVSKGDVDPIRLENARLILPLARWRVAIDDRVRLLAVLDEEGSVTLADCLGILRHTSRPIAAVAALALARVVDMDLDEPIGSRTRVIRRNA